MPSSIIGGLSCLAFSGLNLRAYSSPPHASPRTLVEGGSTRNVIIFSHGLASWGDHYSTLLSYFTSFGYVCLALDHSDGSATVGFRDGSKIPFEVVGEVPFAEFKRRRGRQLEERIADVKGAFEFVKRYRGGSGDGVLDEVMARAEKGAFIALGHSFGGGTAFAATGIEGCAGECQQDAER